MDAYPVRASIFRVAFELSYHRLINQLTCATTNQVILIFAAALSLGNCQETANLTLEGRKIICRNPRVKCTIAVKHAKVEKLSQCCFHDGERLAV